MTQKSFTGRSRQRKTTRLVRVTDILARGLITMGGIGTIIAVSLVCVLLFLVVVPLFGSASLTPLGSAALPGTNVGWGSGGSAGGRRQAAVRFITADEYRVMALAFLDNGHVQSFLLSDGLPIDSKPLFKDEKCTAWSFPGGGQAAFGFEDGTVQLGKLGFKSSFIDRADQSDDLKLLKPGTITRNEGGVVQAMPDGQIRRQQLSIEMSDPVKVSDTASIILLDVTRRPDGDVIAALASDGTLYIKKASSKKNIMTGKVKTVLSGGEVKLPGFNPAEPPKYVLLSGIADTVYIIWEDGKLIRLDTRDPDAPAIAETLDLTHIGKITAVTFLIGKTSLAIGDDSGHVNVWFRVKPDSADKIVDGSTLVHAHSMPESWVSGKPAGPVTSLAVSARTRKLAAGFADGSVRLYYVTIDRLLCESSTGQNAPVTSLSISPKDDGLLGVSDGTIHRWDVFAPHPEATFTSIFRPVWYEGYNTPDHTWQSSSGEDAFEPKFGLQRLIFGTIKATFYAMLFGTPLAILAAIYTSEFLNPKIKSHVKPTIELMASLPSVVLGFIAAIVLAPLVENVVPEILTAVVTIPASILFGAYLWQLLPGQKTIALLQIGQRPMREGAAISAFARFIFQLGGIRFLAIAIMIVVGVGLASLLGKPVEKLLFAGDIKAWLDGQVGTGTGGWMILLTPVAAGAVLLFVTQAVNPQIRRFAAGYDRARLARLDLIKYVVSLAAVIGIAYLAGIILTALGCDPRGDVLGTYVQRNAMVVGFVMGFAIIPIIYTISDDALSAVPQHLRAASLGAGATPWQTTVRIIIPTAASGLFSAIMIGFGRAIGETMVVLMAAGNTPVKEWNIFNGMRTLSATIAVELPEAVQDSTHYRMLFLAAFTLFVMTFVLNTIAEVVRQRFRKRAFQL